jgi:hypothetical protein
VNDESIISPIVDLFREILYDILGLFLPGAALIYVLTHSPFASTQALATPLVNLQNDRGMALLVGASYILGYPIQGLARTLWVKFIIRPVRDVTVGMKGVSPAGLQVKKDIESSALYQSAKTLLGEYCGIKDATKLTTNEVQNLAFSIAGDRAADAYNFSFRADLCSGMALVCSLASLLTIFAVTLYPTWKQWLVMLAAYVILTYCFYLRAKVYFDIRGRIIFAIGLGVLAEAREKGKKLA